MSVKCKGKRADDEKKRRLASGSGSCVPRLLFSSLLIIIAAAGQLTLPNAAASPSSMEATWSCPQSAWRDCLETNVDPDPPQSESPINFSVRALMVDDYISSAIFHYRWRAPFEGWNPPYSFYDLSWANGSDLQNKEVYVVHPGYLGGYQVETFWTVSDQRNNGLTTDVQQIEVAGNRTWPVQCPVADGFDECIDVQFAYFAGAIKVPISDMQTVPAYAQIHIELQSTRSIPIKSATIIYGLYEPGLPCGDPAKVVVYGPNFERMAAELPSRLNATISTLSTSEPFLDLCFVLAVTDDYGRTLVSGQYALPTGKDPAPTVCWTGRLMAVAQWVDELSGRTSPIERVTVLFRNSTGNAHSNETDAWGVAYSPFLVLCGSDTWTIAAVYAGEASELREQIPNRYREATGNYTYYLTFSSGAPRAPTQESVDSGYFTWMALGIIGFIGLMAPFAARHFSEKRRREELKRAEKESRFRL